MKKKLTSITPDEREISRIVRHDKANSIVRFAAIIVFCFIAIGYGAVVILSTQF